MLRIKQNSNFMLERRFFLNPYALKEYNEDLYGFKKNFNKKLNSITVRSNDNYKNMMRKLLNKFFIMDIVRIIVRYLPKKYNKMIQNNDAKDLFLYNPFENIEYI